MSQILFTAPAKESGRMLDIMCGYDRPLNYFFLSIRPLNSKEELDAEHFYDSMMERNGGLGNADSVIGKLQQYVAEYPRGLGIVLLDDYWADVKNFQQGRIEHRITRFPLDEDAQRTLDLRQDFKIIESVLSNDESFEEKELLSVIQPAMVVAKNRKILQDIITDQADACRRSMGHTIPINQYYAYEE